MKKIFLTAFLSLVICWTGCRSKKSIDTANDGLLTLDIARAIDDKQRFDFSDIAAELDFIPLDDKNQSGIIGTIGKIAESKNRFYIVDDIQKPIKIFDRTGKFISTVGTVGRGPNEYIALSEIAVDYERENVYVVDDRGGMIVTRILAYDSAGRMFARNDSIITPLLSWYGDRLVSLKDYFGPNTAPGDTVTLVETYSPELRLEGEIKVSYKGYDCLRVGLQGGPYIGENLPSIFSDNGNSLLVKEARCDTVFRYLNNATLEPAYRLDMGKYFPPAELFNVIQPRKLSFADMINSDKIFDQHSWVSQIYEGERYIIIKTNKQFFIFDRRNLTEGFWATGSDGQSGLSLDGIAFTPSYIRDNRLVGYMQAFDIVNNADAITNPDFAALAATLKEDDNPVIVALKLKR